MVSSGKIYPGATCTFHDVITCALVTSLLSSRTVRWRKPIF